MSGQVMPFVEALVLLNHAEREADQLSNMVHSRRASTLAYELRKTLAELRSALRRAEA